MDSMITAAACALAAGDPLSALNYVALRNDAPALALRGISMAQLGELARAKALMRNAARAFGTKNVVARARCVVAEAEIALVARDLGWPAKDLQSAQVILEQHGDHLNAVHARHLESRRLLLIGRLDDAARTITRLDPSLLPPASLAAHEMVVAGIAIRRIQPKIARAALDRAQRAAQVAGIPALQAEVETALRVLDTPAARVIAQGEEQLLMLDDIETLLGSVTLVVDACRLAVRHAGTVISFATRPVLFVLARALAETWPAETTRNALIARAFRTKVPDESHRARLRVEIGRLRKMLGAIADIKAAKDGFVLVPHQNRKVAVLTHTVEEKHAAILAFLADGEAWSSSALALVLSTGQRTIQRTLDSLAAAGKVQSFGHGRARRWTLTVVPGFTTTLLLPVPLLTD